MWLDTQVELLVDATAQKNINDIQTQTFIPASQRSPNFGSTDAAVWMRLEVNNESNNKIFFLFDYPILDTIEFFAFDVAGRLLKHSVTGAHFPFSNRELLINQFAFEIPQGEVKIWIRVRALLNLQLPAKLVTQKTIIQSNTVRDFAQGIYLGMLLLAVFASIFVGIRSRKVVFFAYIGHIIGTAFITLHLGGYAFQYCWPNQPWMNIYEPIIFGFGIFSTLFSMVFLDTGKSAPRLHKWFLVSLGINFIVFPLALLGFLNLANQIVQMVGMLGCSLMLIGGIILLRQGYQPARFFVLAWSIFLVGVIITILQRIGYLPYNTFTLHASQIGSGLDTILLSFAIAERVYKMRIDRDIAQKDVIRIVEEKNLELNQKVMERTEELNLQNKKLKELTERKDTLIAIIGHDLRGPIGSMSQLLDLMESDSDFDIRNVLPELKATASSSYFLLENLLGWANIQSNSFDINKEKVAMSIIVEETLNLFKTTLRNKNIELLIKNDFENQHIISNQRYLLTILRNLVNNAIKFSYPNSIIKLNLIKLNSDKMMIEVEDNGIGMDEKKIKNLFSADHKQLEGGTSGEMGSGLGITLICNLTEQLRGTIEVKSEKGKGSVFRIVLPTH